MIVVVITGLVGFVLTAYLSLLGTQNANTVRSQVWNASIPVIEAGCEDALTHLNTHGTTNLNCDGWTLQTDQYVMTRWVGNSTWYQVGISNWPASPVIVSRGYVPAPMLASTESYPMYADAAGTLAAQTYLVRGVRLNTRRKGMFVKAMVAKNAITISGNVLTDSYNSTDPAHSTGGLYDPAKALANGDVASDGQLIKEITTSGSVQIYGHIETGPGGTIGMSGAVSIGDAAWVSGGHNGLEPGFFKDDMNVTFPDVAVPFNGGTFPPITGFVGTTNYTYVLNQNVNYQISSINLVGKQKIMVTTQAVLYVTGNLSMSGQSAIIIAPGASLTLYVGGPSASLSGQGVMNGTGFATNFVYYGLPGNTSVSLSGGSGFTGIIYAPEATLNVSGGSLISGATISGSVSASGGFNFHYDESLANFGNGGSFIITSWNEMTPSDLGSTMVTMVPPSR